VSTQPNIIRIPPMVVELDRCLVYILEVTSHEWLDGKKHYLVTCKVKCGKLESQVFTLDVTDQRELEAKLKAEIARFKLINLYAT